MSVSPELFCQSREQASIVTVIPQCLRHLLKRFSQLREDVQRTQSPPRQRPQPLPSRPFLISIERLFEKGFPDWSEVMAPYNPFIQRRYQ